MGFLVSDTVLYSDWLDTDLEPLYLYMEVYKQELQALLQSRPLVASATVLTVYYCEPKLNKMGEGGGGLQAWK